MQFTTENWPFTKSPQDGKPEKKDYQRDGPARPPLATIPLFTAATGCQQELAEIEHYFFSLN